MVKSKQMLQMTHAISHLCADTNLKTVIDTYGPPVIQQREQGFASMLHIILEQQVSIASAKACYVKLSALAGPIIPKAIIDADEAAFRSCGVSRQKTVYIKDLAARVLSGELNFSAFASMTEPEVRENLLSVKGVGNWSADVYLMFCLQSPDIIPLGDIAIRNTIAELYGVGTMEGMQELSETWKPFRTMASFILWHYYLGKRNRL